MSAFADSFYYLCELIDHPEEHNLTTNQIEAIKIAQRAISSVELLGIITNRNSQKPISLE